MCIFCLCCYYFWFYHYLYQGCCITSGLLYINTGIDSDNIGFCKLAKNLTYLFAHWVSQLSSSLVLANKTAWLSPQWVRMPAVLYRTIPLVLCQIYCRTILLFQLHILFSIFYSSYNIIKLDIINLIHLTLAFLFSTFVINFFLYIFLFQLGICISCKSKIPWGVNFLKNILLQFRTHTHLSMNCLIFFGIEESIFSV